MKKLRKIIALTLTCALAVSVLSFTGCQKSAEESDTAYVQENQKLIVGITDFAPMDYKEEGSDKWIGFDADLANLFAESLGVQAEFIVIEWDNKFLDLQTKSIDCIWNGMTITDEVTANSSCSDPYAKNSQVVVMKEDALANYTDVDSLADLKFAAETGSAGAAIAKENKWNLTVVGDQAAALMEVASGSVDACVIDSTMADSMTGADTDYADLGYSIELNREDYGISFRKDSDLTEALNKFMADKAADGTLKELSEKYSVSLADAYAK